MGCVYLARCMVNGKPYVGKTTDDFEDYLRGYELSAVSDKPTTRLFIKALRKYGFAAFEWTILTEDDDNEFLCFMEQKWIERLGTKMPNGYNMTDGGDGGAAFAGKTHSAETKKKIGKAISIRQKENPSPGFSGKVHTDETKQKIRESSLKYSRDKQGRFIKIEQV